MLRKKPFFVRPLTISASASTDSGYPASNLAQLDSIGLVWRNNGGGAITGSFQGEVDFCAVLAANATSSTTIRVQCGSFDSGTQPFINPSNSRSRDGLYHSHTEFPSVQSGGSYSVTISHPGSFEAPILVLGKKVEPTRFYEPDTDFGVEDLGKAEVNRHGVLNSEPGIIMRTLALTLNWQSEVEWEEKFRPLIEGVGTTQPVYCCFDPQPTAYRQARTYYGWFEKSPTASGRRKPSTWGGDFNMRSLI